MHRLGLSACAFSGFVTTAGVACQDAGILDPFASASATSTGSEASSDEGQTNGSTSDTETGDEGGAQHEYSVEFSGEGSVATGGTLLSGTETELWDDDSSMELGVCTIGFALAGTFAVGGCPSCDYTMTYTLSEGLIDAGDCAPLGYIDNASSHRNPVELGIELTSIGMDPEGELRFFDGQAWVKVGTISFLGTPEDGAEFILDGTDPRAFSF